MSKSRFGEGERRKGEKKARARERSSFDVIFPHFLLLRDQTTWKRRFEKI